jgi:transposase
VFHFPSETTVLLWRKSRADGLFYHIDRGRTASSRGLVKRRVHSQVIVVADKIILLSAQGKSNQQIAALLNTDPHTVGRWMNRFRIDRLEGLIRKQPTPNSSHISKRIDIARRILVKTAIDQPGNGSRWTIRSLAAEMGISRSIVHRVWQDAGLKPHLHSHEEETTHPQT